MGYTNNELAVLYIFILTKRLKIWLAVGIPNYR